MPIDLDELLSAQVTTVKPPVRATWFNPDLTGVPGGSTGRLNALPAAALELTAPRCDPQARLPITVYTAEDKFRVVPLIPSSVAEDFDLLAGTDMLIGGASAAAATVSMVPTRAIIRTHTDTLSNKTSTQVGIVWASASPHTPAQVGQFSELVTSKEVKAVMGAKGPGGYPLAKVLADWAADLMGAADDQTKVSLLERHVWNLFDQADQFTREPECEAIAGALEAMDRAGATTNAWSRVYRRMMASNTPENVRERLRSQSVRLALTGTLDGLHQAISAGRMAANPAAAANPKVLRAELGADGSLVSDQQWAAISEPGPLTMVVAGAGSGKTSTMAARITALAKCGVAPEQIMIMSFTNAAVDAMVGRARTQVKTTTFASMLMNVVRDRLGRASIAEPAQLLNALAVHRSKAPPHLEPVYITLAGAIRETDRFSVDPARLEDLRSLILEHPSEVMEIANLVGLITLDMVGPLVEHIISADPNALARTFAGVRFLMVDEAQDTSTVELDVTLRAALAGGMNLFIIGDPSQNLYQFRGASPDALVSLASSQTARTVDLTTNYRSNQDILDLGNALLERASATNVTGLTLVADSLRVSSPDEFAANVRLVDAETTWSRLIRQPIEDAIRGFGVERQVRNWLDKDWTVGVLTPTGRTSAKLVSHIAEALKVPAANLTSTRGKAFVGLSAVLVSDVWGQVALTGDPRMWPLYFSALAGVVDPRSAPSLAGSMVSRPLTEDPTTFKAAQDWWLANAPLLKTVIGGLPGESDSAYPDARESALTVFTNSVLQFEQSINRKRSANLSRMNGERKTDHAQLSAGTIHSAKGLEFDATVVVVDTDRLTSQEAVRLYYVALTRARHQTLIVTVGADRQIRLAWERTLASRVRSEVFASKANPDAADFKAAAEKHAHLFE
jgi:DNA helicase-2/ATP-dependent DNA helicase PcrA